ncbi:hypothetical protein HMPREF1619_02072 [Klebsiella pneumoniae 909957]|nr:hypothetical protein VK055_4974 [Klebsiella pneumoniae subsp. pneumoniae]AVJ88459.1 hypothetical protein CSC00_3955 [Klebsiella pneumoniae]ESB01700.1 hypothetical protein HMPREF1619_02072 [Klebsiella pneumoniae 909957]
MWRCNTSQVDFFSRQRQYYKRSKTRIFCKQNWMNVNAWLYLKSP